MPFMLLKLLAHVDKKSHFIASFQANYLLWVPWEFPAFTLWLTFIAVLAQEQFSTSTIQTFIDPNDDFEWSIMNNFGPKIALFKD